MFIILLFYIFSQFRNLDQEMISYCGINWLVAHKLSNTHKLQNPPKFIYNTVYSVKQQSIKILCQQCRLLKSLQLNRNLVNVLIANQILLVVVSENFNPQKINSIQQIKLQSSLIKVYWLYLRILTLLKKYDIKLSQTIEEMAIILLTVQISKNLQNFFNMLKSKLNFSRDLKLSMVQQQS
ncbi:hypothetical protein pb186bvf_018776 [Paramecium bursaria]